jgi:ABC-type antimicrobial peptide transport system permease subunit
MPTRQLKAVPATTNVLRYWGLAVLIGVVLEIQWILIVQPRILSAGIAAITAGLIGILAASIYFSRRVAARRA